MPPSPAPGRPAAARATTRTRRPPPAPGRTRSSSAGCRDRTRATTARAAPRRAPVRVDRRPVLTVVPPRTAGTATVLRAVALGAAGGARSTAGVTALAFTSHPTDGGAIARRLGSRAGRLGAAASAAGELVADKLPVTPGRSGLPGLIPRVAFSATAAAGVAA